MTSPTKGNTGGTMATTTKKKKKRTMSPEAKARIAAAQKARWARIRAGGGLPAKRGRPVGSKNSSAGNLTIESMSIEDMVATKSAIEKRLRELKKLLSTAGVK
jgi:hypothetical protein